jgi:hypothetical protein
MSTTVAFKSLHYTVVEGAGHVTLTVIKRCPEACTFRVMTADDTAEAQKDYQEKDELVTIPASQSEALIEVGIIDDDAWEPDKDFYVRLCHNDAYSTKIAGEDTST